MQPPNKPEIEKAVIGAVLVDGSIWPMVQGILTVEDFYIHRHRYIWLAFRKLDDRSDDIDLLTVSDELNKKGQLKEVGGEGYLTELINATPTIMHAESHAKIVREASQRRQILQAAQHQAQGVHDEGTSVEELVSQGISQLVQSQRGVAEAHRSLPKEAFDRMYEAAENPTEVWGIRTGFSDYDHDMGGLHPGQVMMIVGGPGAGKSALLGQMIYQIAGVSFYEHQVVDETPAAIFSLEMDERLYHQRIVSALAHFDTKLLESGFLTDDDFSRALQAFEKVEAAPVYMNDQPDLTTSQLRAEVARLSATEGVRVVGIDYLMLLGDSAADDQMREEVISRNIKKMAREHDVAVVVVQSMTKEGMRATLADLTGMRGSGQLAHDADTVTFLSVADDEGTEDKRIWYPRKARNANMRKMWELWYQGAWKLMKPWDLATTSPDGGSAAGSQGEIPF